MDSKIQKKYTPSISVDFTVHTAINPYSNNNKRVEIRNNCNEENQAEFFYKKAERFVQNTFHVKKIN